MGFFDFLGALPRYTANAADIARMNQRRNFLIEPFRTEIAGARVLDIAAHDGRWSYALAEAGAREVHGIEPRLDLIADYATFPETPYKSAVRLEQGDLYDALPDLVAKGETYDIVALFGIYYHVMDHFFILRQIRRLKPRLILIDSEFMKGESPYIQLSKERVEKHLNAVAQIEGQEVAIKGTPSSVAMERMAEALDYQVRWLPWEGLPPSERVGVSDYFRETKMIRRTCALIPLSDPRAARS